MTLKEKCLIYFIFISSFLIRSYRIENNTYIIWDEGHFLKFAKYYLNRKFFFDVHPPLGKLFIAFLGYLFNMDTNYIYKASFDFPQGMDYLSIRNIHAFISSFVPVIIYLTLKEIYSTSISFITSLVLLFDHSFILLSKMIIIDVYLYIFLALSIYFFVLYSKYQKFIHLLSTGISLGLLLSIKWTGLFTIIHLGVYFLYEIYNMLKFSFKDACKRLYHYVFCLLLIPIIIYITSFYIHFLILNTPSDELIKMDSAFQRMYSMKNKEFIQYGDIINIKHKNLSGGLMHMYTAPKRFVSLSFGYNKHEDFIFQSFKSKKFVESDEFVMIYNLTSQNYLCVDKNVSSRKKFNKSCVFKIKTRKNKECIAYNDTSVSFLNLKSNCYLSVSNKTILEQRIIECSNKKEYFTIEDSTKREKSSLNPSFFSLFLELNKRMFLINQSFILDADLNPKYFTSTPKEWLFLNKKIYFKPENKYHFAFSVNKVIWYFASSFIIFLPFKAFFTKSKKMFFVYFFYLGWIINYLPYFFMKRVMYFHHYLPAYMYSVLLLAHSFQNIKSLQFIILLGAVYFIYTSQYLYGY